MLTNLCNVWILDSESTTTLGVTMHFKRSSRMAKRHVLKVSEVWLASPHLVCISVYMCVCFVCVCVFCVYVFTCVYLFVCVLYVFCVCIYVYICCANMILCSVYVCVLCVCALCS